jgi:hypothetical protein
MSSAENFFTEADSITPVPGVGSSVPVAVRTQPLVEYEARGNHVYEPVGDIDAALSALKDPGATPTDRAHGVLAALRRMVRAETGGFNLSSGLGYFLDAVWSGPTMGALTRSVFHRATALAHGRLAEAGSQDQLVRDLHDIVEWYAARRASLTACRHEGFGDGDPDCLFNVRIARDVEQWGIAGLVVECGVRLIARAHETLWFKVSARRGNEYVRARPEWRSWRDETDALGGEREEARGRFAALTPIRPLNQRTCIDTVAAFVPYAALDLPVGRVDVEFEAGIYTQAGELVVAVALPELLQVGGRIENALVAPQEIGVWSRDPVCGHELSGVRALVRLEGDPGWEEPVIETRCDLVLVGCAGERLEVEVRLRHRDGGIVVPGGDGPVGLDPVVARVPIFPRQLIERLFGVRAVLELTALGLAPGNHSLLAEITVCARDGRIVCGAVTPVDVQVPAGWAESEARGLPLRQAALAADLDIGPVCLKPRSHNNNVALAVDLPVAAHDWSVAMYRCEVTLRSMHGAPITNVGAGDRPVLRNVWFGGERDQQPGAARVVRAMFDGREFARFLKTLPAAERTIVARVGIYSVEGDLVFETTGKVAGDFVAEVKSALPVERPSGPVQVVSLEPICDGAVARTLTFELTLNVDRSALPSQRCAIYYELLDEAGKPIAFDQGGEDLVGEVVTVELPFAGATPLRRWYQTQVSFSCAEEALRRAVPHGIKLTTFSPHGDYLETIQASFAPGKGSFLRMRTRTARHDRGDGGGSVGESSGSISTRFLSRVRSALIG